MPPRALKGLTPASLESALKGGPPGPLYILQGGSGKDEPVDPIALGRCVAMLRKAAVGDADDEWNTTLLAAEKVPLSEMLDAAGTFAFGGGRRLVLVKGAGEISAARDDSGQAEQIEAIRALARAGEKGAHPAVVVMVDPPLDGRLKVHKALVEAAAIVVCASPSAGEMPRWIAAQARGMGVALEPAAAELLAGIVGPDTLRARAELEKLRPYLAKGGAGDGPGTPARAGVDDVAAIAAGGAIVDSWRLGDAVAALDEGAALRIARDLVEAGEEPIAVLGALAFRLRQMIRAAEAVASGTPVGAIPGVAKLWGPTTAVVLAHVREYDAARIPDCLHLLYAADRAMKSGGDSAQALYAVIGKLIRTVRRVPAPRSVAARPRYTGA